MIFKDLDKKLEGAPDSVLTAGLLLAGIFAIIIALFSKPTFKAVALAWMIAP
jgi:hypothetical protein